ncbi:MAG: NAD(P)-dependent oxidoreductase [Armatimonadetes bacterium]|nr:NAD(P)-dependent oxidoreductase [Armatimonadota bacterium]
MRELAGAGHEVTNVDNQRPKQSLPGNFIRVALSDLGAVYDAVFQVRPDVVCHIAANPAPSGDARADVFTNNVLSSYHVFQAAGDAGAKRFVYASSEMATGWITTEELPTRFPFDETERVPSPNAYALSKFIGEVLADGMTLRYPDMPIVSLRINNVIAPENYHWLQDRRDDYPNGGSFNFWSYIDVRDVATAFRAAAEGDTTGHEVFLIAAGDTCLHVPLADALTARYGENAAARIVPGHDPFGSAFDCGKIKQILGWTPQHSWRTEETPA